jgi:hypothetical protein
MQIDIENASKEELKASLLIQSQLVSGLQNQLKESLDQLSSSESLITNLKNRIAWYESQYFGSKSEKLIPQDPRQSSFFDVPEEPPASISYGKGI